MRCRTIVTGLLTALVGGACSSGPKPPRASPQVTIASNRKVTPAEQARADSGRAPYTSADVQFMQGMIVHHAQAVVMARWAPTHGARNDVKILASRIDVAQRDEIVFMQRWLRDRHETVPDPLAHYDMPGHDTAMAGMAMPGMSTSTDLMPGMLTPRQMATLRSAAGAEFDRLFLAFMIQHHQGALKMLNNLFSNRGAGQDEYVFRFASDVSSDQTTEIERMQSMLSQTSTHVP